MGTVVKGLFRNKWQPQLQIVRHKTKVNVTRPRLPHFERALLESVCQPYFKNEKKLPYMPDFQSCTALAKKPVVEEEHPLKTLLAKQSLNWFENSRMIAFFHMNALNPEEKFECQLMLKKNGMKLLIFSRTILQKAFKGTIYGTVLNLYDAPTATVFSPEPNIHELLNVVKKLPKLALMGAIVDKRLLSLSELQYFGKFGTLTNVRAMLLNTLNSTSQNVLQQISHHPNNVLQLLNQHKEILQEQ